MLAYEQANYKINRQNHRTNALILSHICKLSLNNSKLEEIFNNPCKTLASIVSDIHEMSIVIESTAPN